MSTNRLSLSTQLHFGHHAMATRSPFRRYPSFALEESCPSALWPQDTSAIVGAGDELLTEHVRYIETGAPNNSHTEPIKDSHHTTVWHCHFRTCSQCCLDTKASQLYLKVMDSCCRHVTGTCLLGRKCKNVRKQRNVWQQPAVMVRHNIASKRSSASEFIANS